MCELIGVWWDCSGLRKVPHLNIWKMESN